MERKDAFIYEEGGFYFLTDRFAVNTIRFDSEVERQKWIDNFPGETGKLLIVMKGKPDPIEEMRKDQVRWLAGY